MSRTLQQLETDRSTRLSIDRIIDHEFRGLSTDHTVSKMSAFDLIDHCSQLFEELVKLRGTQRGLRKYVRAYLIFSYFITIFIMVHFEGFARFMKNSHADFIIYLNLYHFFRSDKVLKLADFNVDLESARKSVLDYLALKELLTFDADELFGWLDEYVDYLKQGSDDQEEVDIKQPSEMLPQTQISTKILPEMSISREFTGSTGSGDDIISIKGIDDFSSRFPDISASKTADSVPYPVKPLFPMPLLKEVSQNEAFSSSLNGKRMSVSLNESLEPPLLAPPPVPRHEFSTFLNGSSHGPSRPLPEIPPVPPFPLTRTSFTEPNELALSSNVGGMYNENHDGTQRLPLQPRSVTKMNQNMNQVPPFHVPSGSWQEPNQIQGTSQYSSHPVPIQNAHRPKLQIPQSYGDQTVRAQSLQKSLQYPMAPAGHRPSGGANYRSSKSQWMHENSVCGLKNLGSSCYINLTLQMLVGLERFTDLFYYRSGEWLTANSKNTLSESTASLVATFITNGGANIAPTKFLKLLARLKPDFNIPNEQQDAQEFLIFLLDRLHEDLSRKPSHPDMDYIAKWDINVNPNDRDQYLEWYRNLIQHEGESQVNDMCQGHVQNKLICNKCNFSSISYSPFTILSLPIPHTNREGVDLTDCLRYYSQDEILSGENAWKCPKCYKTEDTKENPMDIVFEQKRGLFRFSKRSKSPSKKALTSAPALNASTISIKQLNFIKLPPVLFIHLSRFHMFNLTDKLDTDIAYPLRLLFNRNDHEITYALRGLVNHYGNLHGGHYTSIVKKSPRMAADDTSPPVWCLFDDDHVRINVPYGNPGPSANKVHSRDVYVLCYERV